MSGLKSRRKGMGLMEWRTLNEFPFHEISEDGQVRTKCKLQTKPKGYLLKGNVHGTHPSGSKNPRALLNEEQVKEIRKRFKGEHGEIARLAKEYGVSHTAMFQVVHKIQWRDVI